MMRAAVVVACMLLGFRVALATADPAGCEDAASGFASAQSDVSDDLRTYSSCIDDSDGHDDCSQEFSALRGAQDDFEEAVSAYQSECD